MPGNEGLLIPSESRPHGPQGSRAIFNPTDPEESLAEFMVFFLLPLSLTQVQSLGLKNNPWKGKKGEFWGEREGTIRMEPLDWGESC